MECLTDCITVECHPARAILDHEDPKLFVKSQWPLLRPVHYLIYRILVALFVPLWIGMDVYDESRFYASNPALWFIFATNWGFLLVGVVAILHAGLCVYYHAKPEWLHSEESCQSGRLPVLLKILWAAQNIAYNSALVISFSYWVFLTALDHSGFMLTVMSRVKHTANTAYVLLDLFLSAYPIRVCHVIYVAILASFYVSFNAIYFLSDGKGPDGRHYAYYVLDWTTPAQACVTIMLEFMLSFLVQIFLYGLYQLRMFLFKKIYAVPDQDDNNETDTILSQRGTSYDAVESMEMDRGSEPKTP